MTKFIGSKRGRVIIATEKLRDWKSGKIITCKECEEQAVVKPDSLCDIWKLCPKHAYIRWRHR